MNKKKISITVGIIVLIIIVALLVLFNMKKTVEFDTMGGNEVSTQEVKFFRKSTKPEDPTKEGYTFDNWYYDGEVFDFDTRITKDIKIEARWIEGTVSGETYTVKFNTNGGSTISAVQVTANGKITKPADPTREGYKFVSWQVNGKDFDFDTEVTQDMTLTAKWEKEDATTVTASVKSLSLTVGASKKVTLTINPNDTTKTATWASSNTKVATVDKNGNIKAVGVGTATITATVDGVSTTIKVTVKAATQTQTQTQTQSTESTQKEETSSTTEEPTVTYSLVWEGTPDQAGKQTLRIKGSDGNYYTGNVTFTGLTGNTEVHTVTTSGYLTAPMWWSSTTLDQSSVK